MFLIELLQNKFNCFLLYRYKIKLMEIEYLLSQLVSKENSNALKFLSIGLVHGDQLHRQNSTLNLIIMATNNYRKPLAFMLLQHPNFL